MTFVYCYCHNTVCDQLQHVSETTSNYLRDAKMIGFPPLTRLYECKNYIYIICNFPMQ